MIFYIFLNYRILYIFEIIISSYRYVLYSIHVSYIFIIANRKTSLSMTVVVIWMLQRCHIFTPLRNNNSKGKARDTTSEETKQQQGLSKPVLTNHKQRKNRSLVLKWQAHSGYSKTNLVPKNSITWHEWHTMLQSIAFHKICLLFKGMNMFIKEHNWNKLVRVIDIKEGSLTKSSQSLFHSSTSAWAYSTINN